MKRLELQPAHLKRFFAVCPKSQTGLIWLDCPMKRVPAGSEAGRLNGEGYYHVQLYGFTYLNHRIVWALVNQVDPALFQIDHIDMNRANNDPSNLRLATNRQNNQNKSNTSSLGTGVKRCGKRFQARIRRDGTLYHLGTFSTAEEASLAYEKVANALPTPEATND